MLSLISCDQIGLSGPGGESKQLSDEQMRSRFLLQKKLADTNDALTQVQSSIDQLKARQSKLRSANKNKFIQDIIELGGVTPLGLTQATIALVEFTDYQCPTCARHAIETMPQIIKDYIDTGKLRYFVRDFPLPSHQQARYAAVVSQCAEAQGRYWKMHDLLFKNHKRLSSGLYLDLSHTIGLDPDLMSDCLTGAGVIETINNDIIYAQSVGVNEAPKFFIGSMDGNKIKNVIMIKEAQPYSVFSALIDLSLDLNNTEENIKSSHQRKVAIKGEIARLQDDLNVYR
jgi:protein-disulfide isomerase